MLSRPGISRNPDPALKDDQLYLGHPYSYKPLWGPYPPTGVSPFQLELLTKTHLTQTALRPNIAVAAADGRLRKSNLGMYQFYSKAVRGTDKD
jgi:hypothetical protein